MVDGLDKPLRMSLNMSRTFLIDGVGYEEPSHIRHLSLQLDTIEIHTQAVWAIRNGSVGHWAHLGYDPSLSSLFSSVPSPSPSASTGNHSKRSWPYIVGAVVIVAALVVAAVLVVLFVPAAKNLVRPFRGRKDLAKNGQGDTRGADRDGWKKAQTPSLQ